MWNNLQKIKNIYVKYVENNIKVNILLNIIYKMHINKMNKNRIKYQNSFVINVKNHLQDKINFLFILEVI